MTAPAKLAVTVGQAVVYLPCTNYDPRPSFAWTVTKVSPSGKFEVTLPTERGPVVRYFNSQGYEVVGNMNGKLKTFGDRISTDLPHWQAYTGEKARRAAVERAARELELVDTPRAQWVKPAMQAAVLLLEQKLAELKAAVEAL